MHACMLYIREVGAGLGTSRWGVMGLTGVFSRAVYALCMQPRTAHVPAINRCDCSVTTADLVPVLEIAASRVQQHQIDQCWHGSSAHCSNALVLLLRLRRLLRSARFPGQSTCQLTNTASPLRNSLGANTASLLRNTLAPSNLKRTVATGQTLCA